MFCRERRLGPREAADLDASRRVKLAGEARRSLAFALQALLQQFFLGVASASVSTSIAANRKAMAAPGTEASSRTPPPGMLRSRLHPA